jgi:hypothetical protein
MLALWGDEAKSFSVEAGGILAIKNAAIRTYNGERQMASVDETTMLRDSGSTRGKALLRWWKVNSNAHFQHLYSADADPSPINDVRENASERHGGKTFALIKGRVEIQRESISYHSCSGSGCSRKVQPNEKGDALWCNGCQKVVKKPRYRYCLRVKFIDESGIVYMTVFDDVGREMLGMSPGDLLILKVFYCYFFFFFFFFFLYECF